jgi:hypothetical protein
MEQKQISTEYITKFKNALHKRIIEFKYNKKNGDVRTAHGTLNIELMGEENAPRGVDGYNLPDNQIRYYDTDSNGWRSFLVENFIDWID